MSNIFVVSDTWFNRLLLDDQDLNVVDNNNIIISDWNNTVSSDDVVYVLGGFGIADLYHIVTNLYGEIHFLNNFYNNDEKMFIEELKDRIECSNDETLKSRVIFEDCQVMTINDLDVILSYFPLLDWSGKNTGVYCFHGLNEIMDIYNHSISCIYSLHKKLVNISQVKDNIKGIENIIC